MWKHKGCTGIERVPLKKSSFGMSWGRHSREMLSVFMSFYKVWWCHQMEAFSTLLAFVRGIHRSPVNSPQKGQWHGALMFYLICAWTNGWANNRDAGDLRCHRAHYDVTVMGWWWMQQYFHVFFVLSRTIYWTNNQVDDLARHDAHMTSLLFTFQERRIWIPSPLSIRPYK